MPTAVERLSSGLRINRAKDDAAGLGIAEKIQTQVKATTQSMKNANDAISMVQAAEGSLAEVSSMLQRMKELTIQGRNGSYNTSQRKTLTDEIFALRDEINLVAERTTFNGLSLLKSSLNSSIAVTTTALGALAGASAAAGSLVLGGGSSVFITNVVLTNANVGKYNVESTATHITITAVQSTTGLTGVSQTISFADLAIEESENRDVFTASEISLTAGAELHVNFDRLGIKFVVTNQTSVTGSTAAVLTSFGSIAAANGLSSLQIEAGTTQAVFQAGANTRDAFAVPGFKDIRLFDRNLLGDDEINLQNEYRTFSRLNEILKDMAPQTEAVLSA
jgi:flagellin